MSCHVMPCHAVMLRAGSVRCRRQGLMHANACEPADADHPVRELCAVVAAAGQHADGLEYVVGQAGLGSHRPSLRPAFPASLQARANRQLLTCASGAQAGSGSVTVEKLRRVIIPRSDGGEQKITATSLEPGASGEHSMTRGSGSDWPANMPGPGSKDCSALRNRTWHHFFPASAMDMRARARARARATCTHSILSTREVRPSTREVRPSTREVRTSTPEVRTSTREVRTSTREVRTSTREVRTSTPEVRTSTREVRTPKAVRTGPTASETAAPTASETAAPTAAETTAVSSADEIDIEDDLIIA